MSLESDVQQIKEDLMAHHERLVALETVRDADKETANVRHKEIRESIHNLRNEVAHREDVLNLNKAVTDVNVKIQTIISSRAFWRSQWFQFFSVITIIAGFIYWFGTNNAKQQDLEQSLQLQQQTVHQLDKIADDPK